MPIVLVSRAAKISATSVIAANDYMYALGGLHVGGSGDPGTDNLRVDGTAAIGGNFAPVNTLHIQHPVGTGGLGQGLAIEQTSGGNRWHFYTWSTGALHLFYNNSDVGNFNTSSGAYTATSDRRRKKNII